MGFKWDTNEKDSDISLPDIKNIETEKEGLVCNTFTTCPKYNEEELKEFQRIKACWDNVGDIQYDKETGCFFKIEDEQKIFFNYGTCPICNEMYVSRIGIKCVYKELTEICRECK